MIFLFFFCCCIQSLCLQAQQNTTFKIAFGSCGHQKHPLPIFNQVVEHSPKLFVFLGDNIYGDTWNMKRLAKKYQQLGAKESYQNLKKNVEILATWDDHDYGQNDAGKGYPFKKESKEIFLNFFEEPLESSRRKHPGIYHAYYYEHQGKTIQIILLDNRTFRDKLRRRSPFKKKPSKYFYRLDYQPHRIDSDATLLGENQWLWLEEELSKPADLRIIGSGTQFGIEYNGYEAWANFPAEQERFLKLIQKTQAEHLLFISGDVHYAEISKLQSAYCYPIYDVTASGLSSTWHFATPNKNRIEGPIMHNHFGLLSIDFLAKEPFVRTEIWDINKNQRVEYTIELKELEF